jgi:hypothetical protein
MYPLSLTKDLGLKMRKEPEVRPRFRILEAKAMYALLAQTQPEEIEQIMIRKRLMDTLLSFLVENRSVSITDQTAGLQESAQAVPPNKKLIEPTAQQYAEMDDYFSQLQKQIDAGEINN